MLSTATDVAPTARQTAAETDIFCHGPLVGQSLCATILSPVSRFCPGSALGRHLMGSDEEQVGQPNSAQ